MVDEHLKCEDGGGGWRVTRRSMKAHYMPRNTSRSICGVKLIEGKRWIAEDYWPKCSRCESSPVK
jgi:hypothetical protein